MLSESVYNFAVSRRADQDSDSQFDAQAQIQLGDMQNKPARNKRKNFQPISSRMASEISDESEREDPDEDEDDEDQQQQQQQPLTNNSTQAQPEEDFERRPTLLPNSEDRPKQRLNNNEASPMDLSVAPRSLSSEGEEDSSDSFRHKFILEQLRSQKLYSPGTEVLKKTQFSN